MTLDAARRKLELARRSRDRASKRFNATDDRPRLQSKDDALWRNVCTAETKLANALTEYDEAFAREAKPMPPQRCCPVCRQPITK